MKKIIVVGAKGKMGRMLCETLRKEYEIIEIDKNDNIFDYVGDAVIDFGSAESSVISARFAYQRRVPLIVGSTGQTKEDCKEIFKVGDVAPVMKASNFSLGVLLIKRAITELAKMADEICIFEKHHKQKKDAPSGTAVDIKALIETATNKSVQVAYQRGGEEIGTHIVDFYFCGELVSVTHKAFSRQAFVQGVKRALNFILKQSEARVYELDEIL